MKEEEEEENGISFSVCRRLAKHLMYGQQGWLGTLGVNWDRVKMTVPV